MKITRNTEQQLILEKTSLGVGAMLIVMMVASVGMGAVFIGIGISSGTMLFTIMGALVPVVSITVCGLALRMFVERLQLIFDRAAGTITLRTRKLKGDTEVIHDLATFAGAKLERHFSHDRKSTSRIVLLISGGMSAGEHPVSNTFTSGWGPKKSVATINDWFGVTPEVD